MAKLAAKEAGMGSEEGSSRVSRSHSITDSDTYTQERKNSWQSAEELRKYKDNSCREKQNSGWRHRMDEPKCNIQKENKMMSGVGQPPIITHTAATPQDSPNTTLDVGYRDLNYRASQCSIPSGLLKLPDNASKFSTNNLIAGQFPRRISLVTAVVNPSSREFSNSSPPRIQRGYSWRLSRPSLRRKRWSQSDEEQASRTIVLNNGRSAFGGSNYTFNGGYLHGSIRNDTQCDAPNNRTTVLTSNNRSLSPNNSIESHGSSMRRYTATPNQASIKKKKKKEKTFLVDNRISDRDRLSTAFQGKSMLSEDMPCSTPRTINNLSMETGALPRIKPLPDQEDDHSRTDDQTPPSNGHGSVSSVERIKKIFMFFEPKGCLKERDDYALYIFSPNNRFRALCRWFVDQKWFDNAVLFFIGLNCITLAMERPNIPSHSRERLFLMTANYIFTAVFAVEMFIKVVATGMLYGSDAYFTSGWNIMDGSLVTISIVDLMMSLISSSSPRIFGILRVFRLLRSLRPLRVINRAPGLKLVVQTLLSSLRPIGNIVLICCTFFVIFGILGVQLFKGAFYYCDGPDIKNVRNKTDCLADKRNVWLNRKYNFDDLGKALMSLFVLSSRDGWVNIMYTGLDAVGVDQQPIENYSEWRLLYFIAFILLVGFFVLNMFVGVVVENFHRCREEQEKEERARRAEKRAQQMEKKRRKMHEPPYYTNYSKTRLFIHNVVTSKYFDLAIAAVIGLNVVTMAMEFYMMPKALTYALKIFNYFFTAVFILESLMKLLALGIHLYLKDKWNQLDVGIVILSVVGIVLEEVESKIIPINPTIIRVMRVLRIARVLKLLKMAKGIRALLDTVMQALPQVGNLGLLFFLLFFIFAALGVELFGRLGRSSQCSDETPCQGLGEHAHFSNFGMAFLTLFRVATGDNWNGIMKDTLRDDCDESTDCVKNCCVSTIIAPIFFVIFVLMAQFVLVNVVVAVLMKHLEESHKQARDLCSFRSMEDELDMETQLERELAAEREELLEVEEEEEEGGSLERRNIGEDLDEDDEREFESMMGTSEKILVRPGLAKVRSLPANFIYNPPKEKSLDGKLVERRTSVRYFRFGGDQRQRETAQLVFPLVPETVQVQIEAPTDLPLEQPTKVLAADALRSHRGLREARLQFERPADHSSSYLRDGRWGNANSISKVTSNNKENKSFLCASRPTASSSPVTPSGSTSTLTTAGGLRYQNERYLLPTAEIYPSKACFARRISTDAQSQSETSTSVAAGSCTRTPSNASEYAPSIRAKGEGLTENARSSKEKDKQRATQAEEEDLDVQSVINERRPSRLRSATSSGTSTTGTSDQCAQIVRVESFAHIYAAEELPDEPPDEPPDESSAFENVSETDTSGSINGSGTVSGSDGSRSISGLVQVVECTTCPAISTDVRIYVDDTDSISSSGHFGRTFAEDDDDDDDDDETPDITMSISAPIDLVDEEAEEDNLGKTEDEPPSLPGPSDPS
ncbi:hypothetical protein HZH66_003363 [Vespula vulgaris]|uniref:Ion transport domain-containing protein n=1 Tax=Vespula vulgaris TaxID=7454 RepID=A0A834KRG4_VESVU|nr:hypothetical protein HZH66_003363 [Vespula vulgaris]